MVVIHEGSDAESIVVEGAQPMGNRFHFAHIAEFQSVGELLHEVLLDVAVLLADELLGAIETVEKTEKKKIRR